MILKIWLGTAICYFGITFINWFEKNHIQKYDPYMLVSKTCGDVYKENYVCWMSYSRSSKNDAVIVYVNKSEFPSHKIGEIYMEKSLYTGYSHGFWMWMKGLCIVFSIMIVLIIL